MLDLSLNHILRICTVSRRCHEKVYNKAFWDLCTKVYQKCTFSTTRKSVCSLPKPDTKAYFSVSSFKGPSKNSVPSWSPFWDQGSIKPK